MGNEQGKNAARMSSRGVPFRPIFMEVNHSTPRPEELSAAPDLATRAAWVLLLDDPTFTELSRIREEFIRALRAGDEATQHFLIDFANELCWEDSADLSGGVTVDMDMDDDEPIDQAAIDAKARQFIEDLVRKEQSKNGSNQS